MSGHDEGRATPHFPQQVGKAPVGLGGGNSVFHGMRLCSDFHYLGHRPQDIKTFRRRSPIVPAFDLRNTRFGAKNANALRALPAVEHHAYRAAIVLASWR
jgi:hypothetical protein